jgi:transcriptional regulator with XRE-family HTH domain
MSEWFRHAAAHRRLFYIGKKMKNNVEVGVTEVDKRIAAKIKERREALGLSFRKVGDRLGMRYTRIQKYEWGQRRFPANLLSRLADALEIPVSYFYDALEPAGVGKNDQEYLGMVRQLRRLEVNLLFKELRHLDADRVRHLVDTARLFSNRSERHTPVIEQDKAAIVQFTKMNVGRR